jgi:DNA polymerase sigma
MVDNFEKVVCVAAAKVPVVKIWDASLYVPYQAGLTLETFNVILTSIIPLLSRILVW